MALTDDSKRVMTLTGQGHVFAVPDTAVIRLGVQTTGENLALIQSENARKIQGVIQVLKQLGVTDIKTFQYTIDKNYEYENGKQIDKGYTVRNIIEIRTNNLQGVGNIIDSAVNAGSNAVELISFDVSNQDYYYKHALNLAVMNAVDKAKSISMNLGIKADLIPIHIAENSSLAVPMQQFQREYAKTPILPGNIKIEAMITADFEY